MVWGRGWWWGEKTADLKAKQQDRRSSTAEVSTTEYTEHTKNRIRLLSVYSVYSVVLSFLDTN